MASLHFEKEKALFKEFYRLNHDHFLRAETAFRVLIRSLLAASPDLHCDVSSRVKDCDECITKFGLRYQQELEENKRDYEIKDYITDLIGIRVTCFYESDVDLVAKLLHDHFKVAGVTDKRALMESEPDTFGYKGVHLDLKLNDKRRTLPEYHGVASFRFEVQIRTIIQHAWSEIDHAISYKRSIPTELDRRIRTLAALFELADKEFLAIRIQSQKLQTEAKTRTPEEPSKAARSHPLDAFSAMALLTQMFPGYPFTPKYVDGFVDEILAMRQGMTDQDILVAQEKHMATIEKFASYVEQEKNRRFNPFTKLRHALYLFDRKYFEAILFPVQRVAFEEWLTLQPSKRT